MVVGYRSGLWLDYLDHLLWLLAIGSCSVCERDTDIRGDRSGAIRIGSGTRSRNIPAPDPTEGLGF